MLAVLHQPARGLGTEKDTQKKDEGWDERRTKLETPGNAADVFDNDIRAEAQEDTCQQQSDSAIGRAMREWIPATTQSCQNMTRAPRMRAGAISAE